MRLRRPFFFIALLGVATAAACTLNPQPLPPNPIENGAESDAGSSFGSLDASRDSSAHPTVPGADSGQSVDASPNADGDGAADDGGGDAGDAGDGGDGGI